MEITKFQCLICSEEKDTSEINKSNRNICQKFCVIMCRYLNFNSGLDSLCVTKTMQMGFFNYTATVDASKYSKSNLTNEAVEFLCCDNCLILARSICDIYKSWSYLQLRLNRSIRLVAEMMNRTSTSMSRSIKNDETETDKCERSEFRNQFMKRVLDKKSHHDFPHLSLEQCCNNQPLINTRVKVENNINFESNSKDDDKFVKTEVHSPYSEEDHYCHSENDHEDSLETGDSQDDASRVKTEAPSAIKIVIVSADRKDENQFGKARTTGNAAKPTKCETCGKVFPSWKRMRKHMAIHSTEKKFKCRLCGVRFKTQSYLKDHMRRNPHLRPPKEKQENEDTSWYTVLKGETARRSKSGRHLGLSWKCNICRRVFRGNKKNHYLSTHTAKSDKKSEVSNLKNYQCDECGLSYRQYESLYRHKKEIHTPNYVKRRRPIKQCPDCGNIFSNCITLAKHRKKYLGKCTFEPKPKELKCNICGKEDFRRPYNLKRHLVTHSSEQSYQCEECGAKFKQGDTLQFHMRIKHSAEGAEIVNARNKRRRLRKLAAKSKKEDVAVDGSVQEVVAFQPSDESSSNITK